jgi:hypothetical protein
MFRVAVFIFAAAQRLAVERDMMRCLRRHLVRMARPSNVARQSASTARIVSVSVEWWRGILSCRNPSRNHCRTGNARPIRYTELRPRRPHKNPTKTGANSDHRRYVWPLLSRKSSTCLHASIDIGGPSHSSPPLNHFILNNLWSRMLRECCELTPRVLRDRLFIWKAKC